MSDDEHLDRIEQAAEDVRLQIAHAHAQLYDREKQHKEGRRQYARDYYARNREALLDKQREYRDARRERDPERYGELRRARAKRWRDGHKEQENAKQRAKYHQDPEKHLQRRARYYAENAEQIKAKRRERYAADKERERQKQQAWRDREKRRRDAGLPVRRLHRVDPAQVKQHADAANAFFARTWTASDVRRMRDQGPPTPDALWAAWIRDCARTRAAYHLAQQREELARLQKELTRVRPGPKPKPRPDQPQLDEDARMDAIARDVNERLRHRDPPRRPQHHDPAAPHPMLQPHTTMGMNR